MKEQKQTIIHSTGYTGVGLHSGEISTITFKPNPENSGVIFIRTDMDGQPRIPADIDHVVDISRGTTIGVGAATVATVEHVLSAIRALSIDNLIVEINGPEAPVADGSALPFYRLLKDAGLQTQNYEREYLEFDKPISFSAPNDNVDVVIVPSDNLKVTFMVDYQHPCLGTQYTFLPGLEVYEQEFAGARTFCFLNEILTLRRMGLIKGGNLNNAVVIAEPNLGETEREELTQMFGVAEIPVSEKGILNNTPTRYYNEFVRHKVVDLIGDIALLGVPVKGHILAARSGHKTNVELVKKLRSLYRSRQIQKNFQKSAVDDVVFDIHAIQRILPHRYPFLLVDKIVEFENGNFITGIKNVTINENFFQGHFPGRPVMPGVLILEAMAQTGGIMLLNTVEHPEEWLAFFASLDNVKWRRPVLPGDVLRMHMKVVNLKATIVKMHGETFVDDKLVCEGDFLAKLTKK